MSQENKNQQPENRQIATPPADRMIRQAPRERRPARTEDILPGARKSNIANRKSE
jgi:hypothetical protein